MVERHQSEIKPKIQQIIGMMDWCLIDNQGTNEQNVILSCERDNVRRLIFTILLVFAFSAGLLAQDKPKERRDRA